MGTQIAEVETPEQIADAQRKSVAIAVPSTPAVTAGTFIFFAGFDGTRNIASNPDFPRDLQSTAL